MDERAFEALVPPWAHMAPGEFDLRVLDQAEYWVDGRAVIRRVTELTAEHLQNVISFLTRRAGELHASAVLQALVDTIRAGSIGCVSAELLAWELTGCSIADTEPAAWLEATTLMRALRREAQSRRDQGASP